MVFDKKKVLVINAPKLVLGDGYDVDRIDNGYLKYLKSDCCPKENNYSAIILNKFDLAAQAPGNEYISEYIQNLPENVKVLSFGRFKEAFAPKKSSFI